MTTPITNPVAINIRYLRQQKRISLRQLARLSGVPKSSIFDIEHEINRDPGVYTVRDIAKALGVTIVTLLTTDLRPAEDGETVVYQTFHFGQTETE